MNTITNLYLDSNIKFETPLELLLYMIPKDTQYFSHYTFYDKECNNLQGSWKRRSFDDLYIIFKTYFPEISKKEALQTIIDGELNFYYCGDNKIIVFHRVWSTLQSNLQSFIAENLDIKNYSYEDNVSTLEDFIEILEN
jgi:hypothetical protein